MKHCFSGSFESLGVVDVDDEEGEVNTSGSGEGGIEWLMTSTSRRGADL